MNLRQLGKRIRQHRQMQNLTIQQVAKAVGITSAYLSMIETGKNPKTQKPSKPSFEVLEKLSVSLQLDLSEVMELSGYSSNRLQFAPHSADTPPSLTWERKMRDVSDKIGSLQSEMKKFEYKLAPYPIKKYPTGIEKFDIHSRDHLLLLSAATSNRDYEITMDFQAAGLQHGETGIMRLPPEVSINSVKRNLQKKLNASQLDNLVLVPWESGVTPYYQPHRFSQADTIRTFQHDLQQALKKKGTLIRVTTPDASAYFSWVKNPKEVLDCEMTWAEDIQNLCPEKPMIYLCLYRMNDLEKQKKPDFTVSQMVLHLLESHNRVVFLTKEERILYNMDAVKVILSNLDFKNEPASIWDAIYRVGIKHRIWDN